MAWSSLASRTTGAGGMMKLETGNGKKTIPGVVQAGGDPRWRGASYFYSSNGAGYPE